MSRARAQLARLVAEIRALEVGLLEPHLATSALAWGLWVESVPLAVAGTVSLAAATAYEFAVRHPERPYLRAGYQARRLALFALSVTWLHSTILDYYLGPSFMRGLPLRLLLAISSALAYLRLGLEPPAQPAHLIHPDPDPSTGDCQPKEPQRGRDT